MKIKNRNEGKAALQQAEGQGWRKDEGEGISKIASIPLSPLVFLGEAFTHSSQDKAPMHRRRKAQVDSRFKFRLRARNSI